MGQVPFCNAIGAAELGLGLKDGLSDLSWSISFSGSLMIREGLPWSLSYRLLLIPLSNNVTESFVCKGLHVYRFLPHMWVSNLFINIKIIIYCIFFLIILQKKKTQEKNNPAPQHLWSTGWITDKSRSKVLSEGRQGVSLDWMMLNRHEEDRSRFGEIL